MTELFLDLLKAWPRSLDVYEWWLSCFGTHERLDRGVWRYIKDGQAVLGQMEGLANVFEGIGWEAELFWDLSKAWPTCLKELIGRRAILGLMEGLIDEFEGIRWEPDVLCDLWRVWPTCLKGLDERPTCYWRSSYSETFRGLGKRVWRGLEADVLWDLSKAWPTCLKGLHERPSYFGTYGGLGRRVWRDWMRARRVLRLMEGLADVFEGVGLEADVL